MPTNGLTDWVTLFRGCLLIALLMLALLLAGLLVDEVPAAWVVTLIVFALVLVEVETAGIWRLRDEDRDLDTEVELEEDDGLRPPPVIVLKKLFRVFT